MLLLITINDYFRTQKKVEADKENNEDAKKEDQSDHDEIEEKINMNNIISWNETVVRDFLTKKKLSDFLPLCNGLNGEELLDLYGMCKSNSVSMYSSLKFELLNIHEKVLPISTFLHFVSQLRVVDDNGLLLNRYIRSEYLDENSQDEE